MALVIRTLYNNRNWKSACIKPGEDTGCEMCFISQVNIRSPQRNDEICSGNCWERYICRDYKWGCTPKGRTFAQAYKGMKVFLVYKHFMGGYTIWATTTVKSIDYTPMQSKNDFEDGFAFIHFESFEPLPRDKWVSDLSDQHIVGALWRQGRFRYIGKEREQYLEQLIECETGIVTGKERLIEEPDKLENVNTKLMKSVVNRLAVIAQHEGRTTEELIREAVAEWLTSRQNQ